MPSSIARRLVTRIVLLACLAQAASAAEILIVDAKSQPESLTVAPGGILSSVAGALRSSIRCAQARPLLRRSLMPALKVLAVFSSGCLPMPLSTHCGPVS